MKTFKRLLSVTFLLLVFSCKKENINGPISSETKANSIQDSAHYIGEHYGGGVIFWLNSTGKHGLIADTVDLGVAVWFNGTYTITGATGTAIGTGRANTLKIILSQGTAGRYAAVRCARYKGSGYKDWFLPSKDELNALYLQKNVVGGFADSSYSCSSEYDKYDAWRQYFYNGFQYSSYKDGTEYVRAVRAF